MRGCEVVDRVGQLASTVERMVELARGKRWALLPLLDAECSELVAQLRAAPAGVLSNAQQRDVESLATGIRSNQALLNDLVRPQFEQLVDRLRESSTA